MRHLLLAPAAILTIFLAAQVARADEDKKGGSSDAPRIGVYDIDRVAAELGWRNDMDTKMKGLATKFKTDFERSQKVYQDQINKQKNDWAPKDSDRLTQDQLTILNNMKTAAEQVLAQLNKNGEQQLTNYRKAWADQYRKALHPMLADVADERKLWVIFEKTESVTYVVPSADITDAVVAAARANPPAITPVPVPDLPSAPPMVVKLPTTRP